MTLCSSNNGFMWTKNCWVINALDDVNNRAEISHSNRDSQYCSKNKKVWFSL